MKQGTKLHSILFFKCPECQQGDFFESHPYDLSAIGNVHTHCPNCGLKYSKEPGFYYGAMYVSYALGTGIFVGLYLIDYLFDLQLSLVTFLIIMSSVMIVGTPYLFHLSKIIWANLFFHYKGKND